MRCHRSSFSLGMPLSKKLVVLNSKGKVFAFPHRAPATSRSFVTQPLCCQRIRDPTSLKPFTTTSSRVSLTGIANRAQRILTELTTGQPESIFTSLPKKRSTTDTPSCSTTTTAIVLNSARTLLKATKDPHCFQLGKATHSTHDRKTQTQICTIHQSILLVTRCCLECANEESHKSAEIFLGSAVELSKRARALGLPVHLPLYQVLVKALATRASHPPILSMIMEIAKSEAEIYRLLCPTAVLTMVENGHYVEADSLLAHRQVTMDPIHVAAIYKIIHRVTKESYEEDGKQPWMKVMSSIVGHLAPLVSSFADEKEAVSYENFLRASIHETQKGIELEKDIATALDALAADAHTNAENELDGGDDHEIHDIENTWEPEYHDEDYDDDDSQDDSDISDEDDEEDDRAAVYDIRVNPLDHLVSYLLLENVMDDQAMTFFTRSSGSRPLNTESDWEDANAAEIDETDDTNMRYIPNRRERDWKLPDISLQLFRLNGEKSLSLTTEFEEYVWKQSENDGQEWST